MSKLYLTNKTERDKLMEYFPIGGVFDTAKAFPEDSSIGLFISGLAKITEEAMGVLEACTRGVLPFDNMNSAFVDEWVNCLNVGSESLPIRFSASPNGASTKAEWVKYTLYGFEELYTLDDLNNCFSKLDIPVVAHMWDTAPVEFKTDLYKITRDTPEPTLTPISSYTPTSGRSRFVLVLKVTGDIFISKGFPYDFPVEFVDNYSPQSFINFVCNLIPYYMTILIKL